MKCLQSVGLVLRQAWLISRNIWRGRRTNWRFTLFELLIPIYPALFFLFWFRFGLIPYQVIQNDQVDSFPPVNIYDASSFAFYSWNLNPASLAFSPNNGTGKIIAERVCLALNIPSTSVSWFEDSAQIAAAWSDPTKNISAGLSFELNPGGQNKMVVHHLDLDNLVDYLEIANITKTPPGTPSLTEEDAAIGFGYMLLQYLGVNALIDELSTVPFSGLYGPLQVQKFPVAATNQVINDVKYMFSLMFISAFFPSVQATATSIGHETEFGIRRTLRLKGMNRLAYWLAWWIGGGVVIATAGLIQILLIYAFGIIKYTNFGIAFALFMLFVFSIHSFCLLLVALYGEQATGKKLFITTMILMTLSQMFFFVVQLAMIDNPSVPHYAVDIMFLFYVVPFSHIMFVMSDSELLETGLSTQDSPFILDAFLFLAFDIFLYFGLAVAIDAWYDYRRNRLPKGTTGQLSNDGDTKTSMAQLNSGIRVRNLVKEFDVHEGSFFQARTTKLRAVDGLSLDVESNKIFCLLGHNGAGKSTTLSILTATIMPTSGDAFIDGLHIVRDKSRLQSSLGVAPQFDICFLNVKCLDQLILFGVMAGLTEDEAFTQATQLLDDLMLTEKTNQVPSKMSGGQKRRLSLAIALMGNPKVLLLDEISTGLDVRVRKCVWTLLQRVKKHCTIILTTHSMEEAEKLGDVIAIMSKGKLQAFGTSLELKRKYSSGYRLHCVRGGTSATAASRIKLSDHSESDVSKLEKIIHRFVKGAKLTTDIGSEISFSLPVEGAIDTFPDMFSELERNKESIGIISFGLSPSTLEDVFLVLDQKQHEMGKELILEVSDKSNESHGDDGGKAKMNNGYDLLDHFACEPKIHEQMWAVLMQVIVEATRNRFAITFVVFWPVITACISGLVSHLTRSVVPVPISANLNLKASLPVFLPPFGVDPSNIVSTLLGSNITLQSESAEQWIEKIQPWDPTTPKNYTGAIDFLELNYTSRQADFTIIYNQTLTGSARSILDTFQQGLSNLVLNQQIEVEFWELQSQQSQNSFVSGGLTFFVSISFCLLASFYAEEQVRTRATRMKDFLLLAGLPRWLFWFSHFTAHIVLLVFTGILVYIIMILFGMEGPIKNDALGYLLHLLAFGCSNILFGYCISQLFTSMEGAQRALGQLLNLSITLPWVIVTFALSEPNEVLESFLNLIPGFGFYRGMAILESAADNNNPFTAADVFVWNRLLIQVILLNLLSALIWLTLLVTSEKGYFRRSFWKRNCCHDHTADITNNESPEKAFERLFEGDDKRLPRPVRAIPDGVNEYEFPLIAKDVRKTFISGDGKPFHACKNVSLAVPRGEIFGLLGPNGAGKTTLLSCINGVDGIEMDGGDAFIMGKSVVTDLDAARKRMGICFQFDALNAFLTGREHMQMFARIRGVPSKLIEPLCQRFAQDLDLTLKIDARAGSYSGGNKRKLSVALALLAHPDVVFLDEPSTGLDPATRRFLWNFLEETKRDKSIVLTTHSMEECDNLSSKIAIMVSGAIRTYGTSQELKSAHGTDFSVTVRIIPGETTFKDILALLKQLAPGSHIDGSDDEDTLQFLTVIKYSVPCKEATLSSLFSGLIAIKEKPDSHLIDFSVSQTSLEDVFIRFAMMQEGEMHNDGAGAAKP